MKNNESRADQLWKRFDHAHQQKFWTQYNALLQKSKRQSIPKKKVILYCQSSQSTQLSQHVFPPHTLYLAKQIGILAIPSLMAFLLLTLNTHHLAAVQIVVLSFLALAILSLFGLLIFIEVNTITISSTHLKLSNPSKKILWSDIVSVVAQEYSADFINPLYTLVITTNNQFQHTRSYKLSKKNHHKLFNYIAQKVTQVDPGKYRGYFFQA